MEENEDTNDMSHKNTNAEGASHEESPEEVKERVKGNVARGVAAVAGALKGFSQQAEKDGLAESTKQAIQKAGETTRSLAGSAQKEFKETKEKLRSGASAANAGGTSGMGVKPDDLPDIRGTDLAKSDRELLDE